MSDEALHAQYSSTCTTIVSASGCAYLAVASQLTFIPLVVNNFHSFVLFRIISSFLRLHLQERKVEVLYFLRYHGLIFSHGDLLLSISKMVSTIAHERVDQNLLDKMDCHQHAPLTYNEWPTDVCKELVLSVDAAHILHVE